jgi:hypothetical protein
MEILSHPVSPGEVYLVEGAAQAPREQTPKPQKGFQVDVADCVYGAHMRHDDNFYS